MERPHRWLQEEIDRAVRERVRKSGEDLWRKALVGVASAGDPLMDKLRQAVDPGHALPAELLPGARSVIVFFLPFRKPLGKANDAAGHFASRSWAQAYVSTNQLIREVNENLGRCLRDSGFQACSTHPTHNFDEQRLVSRWSHKHLAYIAGLGTFGHHHLLITASGCCGRLGSLVTDMPLPATPRDPKERCLLKAGYPCNACSTKCVYGALSPEGFDRHRCYRQCLANDRHHSDLPLVDVCGKCACQVPCSHATPNPLKAPG